MKRVVLLLLASASAVVVLLSLTGGIDLVGPARLLVVAGGIIIVMASVDELMQAAKTQRSAESATAPAATVPEMPSGDEVPVPSQPAVAPVSEPALVLSSADTIIDLRDQPTTLVDELIADGQLSNSRDPIGDHEVPAIVMAAFAHQLSLQAA